MGIPPACLHLFCRASLVGRLKCRFASGLAFPIGASSVLATLRSALLRSGAVYAVCRVYNVILTSSPCTLLELINVSYIYIFLI